MGKKVFSLLLAISLCCFTSVNVYAQADHSHIAVNDASNCNEESAIANEVSFSSELIAGEPETVINSDYVVTDTVDSEYLEWLLDAPDEIISASTLELLEYFLESPFMGQQIFSCSSTFEEREIDFSCHEAFRELISREDCIEVLESYARDVLYGLENTELDVTKFEKLLNQSCVKSIISDLPSVDAICPNLQSIYTASEATASSVGDYVGTLNGINYYSAGTVSTANDLSVEVCTPERELTSSEIAYFNSNYGYDGNIRSSEPTAVYNCHSYAWYRFSVENPYWVMNISQFLYDSACTQIEPDAVQVKDIIVYVDADGYPLHSGVVYSISTSGELTICSKWGQAGVYIHTIDRIPPEYYSNPYAGEYGYAIFRYHDYVNQYTGNQHHLGTRHYFEYADICEICSKQTNTVWKSISCSGPPCSILMNLKDDEDIS